MDFHTVYDIGAQPYPFAWAIPVLACAALLTLGWIVHRRRAAKPAGMRWAALGVLVLLTVTVALEFHEHRTLSDSQARGDVMVVEGPILDHLTWTTRTSSGTGTGSKRRYTTHHHERFRVEDVGFAFRRGGDVGGFQNGGDAPVPLMDGMRVRIHYRTVTAFGQDPEHRILKLEVAGS